MSDYIVGTGELRTRITFQEPTVNADGGGAQSTPWANIATTPMVWSRWINAHGQEVITSSAKQSQQRATITVRQRSDIKTTWRVVKDDGTYWNIVSVDPVQGRRRWIEFIVEAAPAKGTV